MEISRECWKISPAVVTSNTGLLLILLICHLETEFFNQNGREANVTPLFKKGSRIKTDNYRPVSLTSVLFKLLETLI